MRISIIQHDIVWENKAANLKQYDTLLSQLKDKSDLVLLPEMCTTGFSMRTAQLAEADDGESMQAYKTMAQRYNLAIAGSHMASDTGHFFNRGFFIQPNGSIDVYDKRHLFRMGSETQHYSPGNAPLTLSYMGWNIRLIICYDLRFPVWSRNQSNAYDLLLVTANWPQSRQFVWNTLLSARAIENMAYVAGCNRVGTDGMQLSYIGGSTVLNPYGKPLITDNTENGREQVITCTLDREHLLQFREKFPAWKDADPFQLL